MKQCTCDNGDAASGAVCNTHNTPQCVSCSSGHYLSSSACPAWTECTSTNWIAGNQVAGTEYEATAPTATSVTVCTGSEFESVSKTATTDRQCQTVRTCSADEYQ